MSLTLQSLRTLGHRHIDTSDVPGQSVNRVGWVKGPGEFVAHSVKKQDLPKVRSLVMDQCSDTYKWSD